MIYPRNYCYFCKGTFSNKYGACNNFIDCYKIYHYWVGSSFVSFEIGQYFFKFSNSPYDTRMKIEDNKEYKTYYSNLSKNLDSSYVYGWRDAKYENSYIIKYQNKLNKNILIFYKN